MSSFTTPLEYRKINKKRRGKQLYVLTNDFTYHIGFKDSNFSVTVPKGFITDLATTPWPINTIKGMEVDGKLAKAAVLHDWLYYIGGAHRIVADVIFYDACTNYNLPVNQTVPPILGFSAFMVLRLAAWPVWIKRRYWPENLIYKEIQ